MVDDVPCKAKHVEHFGLTNTHASPLTSQSFPARVTSAIAASQTRRQSADGLQGPGIRPLSEFVDFLNSVMSGRLYSESQPRPSW